MDHVALQGALAAAATLDVAAWPFSAPAFYLCLSASILAGYKVLDTLVCSSLLWGSLAGAEALKPKGPMLTDDRLGWRDNLYTSINRCFTTVFYVFHVVAYLSPRAQQPLGKFPGIGSAGTDIVWPAVGASAAAAGGSTLQGTLTAAAASVVQMLLLFALYDAVYVPFHRTLHVPRLYPWIHKHHHRQIAPYRGSYDGINTHPIEFVCGEYLHLLAVAALCTGLRALRETGPVAALLAPTDEAAGHEQGASWPWSGVKSASLFGFGATDPAVDEASLMAGWSHSPGGFVSGLASQARAAGLAFFGALVRPQGAAVVGFLVAAGFMASLNHTRWGVRVRGVFDVRDHDVHHRWPRSNYGQFVMWWDRATGTFKPYADKLDRKVKAA
jgi:sterol desaturase/sphingolipid hydroxylase (fatty acid hydroxylase superfamily)